MLRAHHPERKAVRKTEGESRNKMWGALNPTQKLQALNERLGEGVGAKRQRTKLAIEITQQVAHQTTKQKKKKND
jgi:hypothetical protein